MERIHSVVSDPIRAQDQVFQTLIDGGRDTVWGKQYDYASLRSLNDLKNRFPVQDYDTLKPYIDRIMQGEQQVLWHSHIAWFAKSSGTTSDKSKFIPVSSMALEECHFRGGRDVIAMYLHNNPESKLF
ncbi:MAG TPA: GH3 auxin-responsive promoter family protein, partial [Chitinophagales bacterium]|nr:GH3 auxin-responsive promoter family protein [Chitinophagales bacterium]